MESRSMAVTTASRVIGRSRTRTPTASATAFAIAADTGPLASSPAPMLGSSGRSMTLTTTSGTSLNRRIGYDFQSVLVDPNPVEPDALLQRPTRRLHGTALDLVDHPVEVHHPPDVDHNRQPPERDVVDGIDLGDHRAVTAVALVAGIPQPRGRVPPAGSRRPTGRAWPPSRAPPCPADRSAGGGDRPADQRRVAARVHPPRTRSRTRSCGHRGYAATKCATTRRARDDLAQSTAGKA